MKKILFVCYGNICRSPAAEGIMKKLITQAKLENDFFIDSAGIHGFHIGEKPCDRMVNHAKKRGYILDSRARQLQKSDLIEFDFIVTMDNDNYNDVRSLDYENHYTNKILKMTNFITNRSVNEIPDPYYGGTAGFELVLDLLEEAIPNLITSIAH